MNVCRWRYSVKLVLLALVLMVFVRFSETECVVLIVTRQIGGKEVIIKCARLCQIKA